MGRFPSLGHSKFVEQASKRFGWNGDLWINIAPKLLGLFWDYRPTRYGRFSWKLIESFSESEALFFGELRITN